MHDLTKEGNEYFVCDFCRRAWDESRPMVEGHQGSLVCGPCLALAYAGVVNLNRGETLAGGERCALCLESRAEPHWRSPAFPESILCRRCIRQSAGVLERDADAGWARPK
jgi:hypothetical protein